MKKKKKNYMVYKKQLFLPTENCTCFAVYM